MKSRLTSLFAAAAIIACGSSAFAQGYDDDDIYYNPSKAKQATPAKPATGQNSYNYPTADYPAADTYTPGTGMNVDVDTYNRRGSFAADTAVARSSDAPSSFEYTQQIERFYNPRIIIESPDQDLARIYYTEPSTDLNIYINTPSIWGGPYYSYSPFYYNSPWYWGTPRSWWYYNSWYYDSWAWGPSWSWGWTPGWSYGPSWGWGGYYPPAWLPSRPHRPSWSNRPSGNVRPGYRPGSSHGRYDGYTGGGYGNSRPGYRPGSSGSSRPSGTSPSYRPGSGSSGSGSGYRSGGSGSSRRSSGSNSYSRPSNRSNSSPSYRSGGSGSSRSSGGSYGGGSRGGSHGSGGGGRGRH